MKLYLIRHAQSANNAVYSGDDNSTGRKPDPEITDDGHRQAQLLAGHLAHPAGEPRQHPFKPREGGGYGLTHIYCSLMTRSILTAEYIAEACGLPLVAHPDVFEKGGIYQYDEQGEAEGLPGPNESYFKDRFPGLQLPEGLNSGGWYSRPAETDETFVQRTRTALADIKRKHTGTDDCVGIVMHGDLIDQSINELMRVDRAAENYDSAWVANWVFHNTSISRIDFEGGSQVVVYLNRLDHLPDELVTW